MWASLNLTEILGCCLSIDGKCWKGMKLFLVTSLPFFFLSDFRPAKKPTVSAVSTPAPNPPLPGFCLLARLLSLQICGFRAAGAIGKQESYLLLWHPGFQVEQLGAQGLGLGLGQGQRAPPHSNLLLLAQPQGISSRDCR